MLSNKTFLTTLLSCFILTTGCATQDGESDDADLEITLGGDGKADGLDGKILSLTMGDVHDARVGDTTNAAATVRFDAADKLAVRTDIVLFSSLTAFDESSQTRLTNYIVTFEAQADDPNVTLSFALTPFDPSGAELYEPITVNERTMFEHVAMDFGRREITFDKELTVPFADLNISVPQALELTSMAAIAIPLATSDGSELTGTHTYDLVTTVLR